MTIPRPSSENIVRRACPPRCPNLFVANQRIHEVLCRPTQNLIAPVLTTERRGAFDPAAEAGIPAPTILSPFQEPQHPRYRLEPLCFTGDQIEPQPVVRHLCLAGQTAPGNHGPSTDG